MNISVTSSRPEDIDIDELKIDVERVFKEHGAPHNSECSIALVTEEEMLAYVEKYLHETGDEAKSHPVLSFVQDEIEGPFQFPPDGVEHLGEIIVSLDHAARDAANLGVSLTKSVSELATHAALHLMGVHHD